jgi:tetratricopeptide (TPR) repeat protein
MIRQAEASMASREYEEARSRFEALASQYGPQARVLYGLALVASQQKQPEQARNYFQQAATLSSDPRMKAWSHIYLGRIFDLEGEREQARQEYISALAAGDVSPDTHSAAQQGLDEPFQPPEGVRRARQQPAPRPEAPARQRVPLGGETERGN